MPVSDDHLWCPGFDRPTSAGRARSAGLLASSSSDRIVSLRSFRPNAGGNISIVSCALVGNTYAGLDANGTTPVVLVSNSNLSMNGRGIHTNGSAVVRMTHLDIFFNTAFAWQIEGGQIQTHVDNRVLGTTFGTLTKVSF